jgi:hypothetical protein
VRAYIAVKSDRTVALCGSPVCIVHIFYLHFVVSLRVMSADGYCSLQFAFIHDPDIGLIIYYLLKDIRVIWEGGGGSLYTIFYYIAQL